MRNCCYFVLSFLLGHNLHAQYSFKGKINNDRWQNEVFLSVIEDYRTLNGINVEQIISKVKTDASGNFEFYGDKLENTNKIYKLHVDNCSAYDKASNHFNGDCQDSRDIIFIAKAKDTINFPLGFEDQIFCDVRSTNPKTSTFIKIDSLKEIMKFEYGEFRSKANRELNNKKWFKILQDYGKSLDEPLAELHAYAFLSDRGNNLHNFYLQELKTNTYYDGLLKRLKTTYPKSSYTIQYEAELNADKYIISDTKNKQATVSQKNFPWMPIIIIITLISLSFNGYLLVSKKRQLKASPAESKSQLTPQEQKVLELLLSDYSNKAIATSLFVSLSTVKTHINSIYKKLNVRSREEAKTLFNNT